MLFDMIPRRGDPNYVIPTLANLTTHGTIQETAKIVTSRRAT